MHKFRTVLSVVATTAMVLGTMGVAAAAGTTSSNETRADFIMQLDQQLSISSVNPSTPTFTDVPASSPYYGYIEAAYQKGYISGFTATTFGPNQPITRAQAAKVLVEAYEGGNYSPTATSTKFTDNSMIPTALVGFVAEAQTLGLMNGFVNGSFGPNADLSTAQETHLISQLKAVQAAAGFKITASASDVGPGEVVTLNSSLPNATYAVTTAPSGAAYVQSGNLFSATTPGNYVITGTLNGATATAAVTVYGAPASVVLTGGKTIVADGSSTAGAGAEDTITATVQDANGNTVADFNGSVTLYDTGNMSQILESNNSLNTAYSVNANNGVATFSVESTGLTAGLSDTLTATATTVGGSAVGQGTFTVTSVAPTASALSLSATPASIDVNALNSSTSLSVAVTDAAGNEFLGTPEQVTLSLSGPGSFTALSGSSTTPTTTYTLYVDGSQSVTVYGVEGQTGTISVTASASGITSGSVKIPAVVSGIPAKLGVTSNTGTTTTGVPYTAYTVQLEDAAGNPITSGSGANDAISISDNEGTLGGGLTYWSVANGAPNTSLGSTPINGTLSNGSYSFAVETNGTTSAAPTITIDDTTESFSTTVTYNYQVGAGTQALFEEGGNTDLSLFNTSTPSLYAEAGTAVTLSAELTDAAGNVISKAGQTIDFAFISNTGSASMPNGSSIGVDYAVPTNAQGVASVTVNTGNAGTFQLEAGLPGGTFTGGPTVTVAPAANAATGAQVGWTTPTGTVPSSIQSGASGTFSGQLQNPVSVATPQADQLLVTSSNGSILGFPTTSGWVSYGSAWIVTATASGAFSIPVKGGLAGTASVTITDLSNLNVSPVTETLSVTAGTTASGATFYYNGLPINPANPLPVTANVPVLVQVESTDAGGNAITLNANTTYNIADSNGGYFLIDNNGTAGAPTGTVTIDAGQFEANVFYVNSNPPSSGVTSGFTAGVQPLANAAVTTVATTATGSVNGSTPITFTVKDSSGAVVSGATVVLNAIYQSGTGSFVIATSPTGTGTPSVTATSNSSGQVTVYLANSTVGATGVVEALVSGTANGTISGVTTLTVVGLGTVTVGTFTQGGSSGAYTYTSTVTLADANGNPITGATAADFAASDAGAANLTVGTVTATATPGQYTLVLDSTSTTALTDAATITVTINSVAKTGSNTL
ncbi:MAG: S-layer homology domain-containing protein [Thermaerobacter sp.]|nr:S-layer homology domain-containing protein [Thermaerobacter sp.]